MAEVPLDVRIALLRQHGSFAQAYSATFQAGLEHFGDERGFIAYKRVGQTAFVLSDPIAPDQEYAGVIDRFLAEHPDACFCCTSYPVARILASSGFFVNEMGPESRIDLATYDFDGQDKRNIRRSIKRAERCGYVMKDGPIDMVAAEEIAAVSYVWRRRHALHNRETCFLTRPLVIAKEPDVRVLFVFDRTGRLVAFSVFDPVYELGQVVGYGAQHNRQRPDADLLVQHAIKRRAVEIFRAEGKKWLFLGISPFADIHDHDPQFEHNWLVRRTFRFAYENAIFNRFFYALKPVAVHKRQFRGVTEQLYYAFNRTPSLPRLLKLLRVCSIV